MRVGTRGLFSGLRRAPGANGCFGLRRVRVRVVDRRHVLRTCGRDDGEQRDRREGEAMRAHATTTSRNMPASM
jgi:hypothetical protein